MEQTLFVQFGDRHEQPDVIVILGSAYCHYRVNAAYKKFGLDQRIGYILSGGNECLEADAKEGERHLSEAEYMQLYLLDRGVASQRITVENQSHNTSTNLQYVLELLEQRRSKKRSGQRLRVAIVSGGFHMRRIKERLDQDERWAHYAVQGIAVHGPNTGKDAYGLEMMAQELNKFGLT